MKKWVIILLIVLVIIAAGLFAYSWYVKSKVPKNILSFKDCADAGNLVVETNPRECHTKAGTLYIEEDNHVALKDYIEVTDPKPYAVVSSPFKVEGKAKASWYGNNRLTIKLVDKDLNIIVEKSVFALTDMPKKDTFVPFVAAIDFKVPAGLVRGQLLIEKVNIADIPGKNGPLVIPIRFK